MCSVAISNEAAQRQPFTGMLNLLNSIANANELQLARGLVHRFTEGADGPVPFSFPPEEEMERADLGFSRDRH